MTLHPAIPFEIRLHHLEGIIHGKAPSASLFEPITNKVIGKPVTRQTKELEERIEKASAGTEPLKHFVATFAQYRPLLAVPSATSASADATSDDDALTIGDLLPADAKAALVIEASADIREVERDLREMEVLQQRGVEGAGILEDLLPLRPQLKTAADETEAQKAVIARNQAEAARLLSRYNNYTSTSSDLFLNIHSRLEALEAAVFSLERKKRASAASHY